MRASDSEGCSSGPEDAALDAGDYYGGVTCRCRKFSILADRLVVQLMADSII